MAFWRVQARLEAASGLPADDVTNTTHWESGGNDSNLQDTGDIAAFLATFYAAIEGRFAAALLTGDITYTFYDLKDSVPRVPVAEISDTITLTAASPMPSEVAAVLSYYGTFESGINNASRRGRMYIGPLTLVATEVVAGRVQWTAASLASWVGAIDALATSSGGNNGAHMVTYSPTVHAATGDIVTATSAVVGGWVDNAPDTQRRRGTEPTTRSNWVV